MSQDLFLIVLFLVFRVRKVCRNQRGTQDEKGTEDEG